MLAKLEGITVCAAVKQKGRYGMQGDGTELESEEQAAHLSGPPRLLSSNPDLKGLHLKACGEHWMRYYEFRVSGNSKLLTKLSCYCCWCYEE